VAPSPQEPAAVAAAASSVQVSDLGVQLASVTRALEWAAVSPERVHGAPWLGTSCARRLDTLQAGGGTTDVGALAERLRALDAAPAEDRPALVAELLAAVESLSPLSLAGARLMGLPERGRLLQPRRRRRKERTKDPAKSGDGETAVEAGAPVEAEPAAASEPATPEASEPEAPPQAEAAPAPKERRRKGRSRPVRAPRAEPPPPVLPLGHPEGTGAGLAGLGIPDDLVEAFTDAGIHTQAELLLRRPTAHERAPMARPDSPSEETVMVRGRVASRYTVLAPHGRRRTVVLESPTLGRVVCRWLAPEPPRGWDGWVADAELALIGVVAEGESGRVVYEAEPVGLDGRGSGLLPCYGLPGLDDREVRDVVARALAAVQGRLEDPVPDKLLERHRLLGLGAALRDAHFPSNTGGRGRVRMAFEELLLMQLGVAWRAGRGRPERGIAHKVVHKTIGQLDAQHSVRLRDGQEIAFSEVRRDLGRPRPMARLLQGDVGAGKGLVCLLSALIVAENGNQVAMVAPDALAAERSFLHAEALLRSVGVASMLVGDRVNHAQADAIRRGEAQIVFGTRALLEADMAWKRLGLVVVEERGPYGTVTSGQLGGGKGPRPDLLVTTRVPIPSSLTFTVFGDLDVSVVRRTVPPRCVATVLPSTERQEAYRRVREAVAAGRQAFVVLPVRDGRDLLGYADAMRMAEALQSDLLEGTRIGVYSTDMTKEERSRAFDDFQHRRIDVLVCTTYIEDAPTVANATQILVEYADLHDAVRLHRLRGHVGFGNRTGASYFVLSDSPAPGSAERVERVAGEPDGFRLAELDLGARGAKALLGDRAAEMPEFHWAAPEVDRELLLRAREEAMDIISKDGALRRVPELAAAVTARWGEWLGQAIPESAPRGGGEPRNRRRRRRRRR
jgi:ATP-dependent DNA helicase RecG